MPFLWLLLLVAGTTFSIQAEPYTLDTPTGTLYGTLEMPQHGSVFPAALIIAGSGPTDRDGNSPLLPGRNDSLKLLADSLASNGIASVRFDKRAIAESAGAFSKESDLRFETYIDDAVQWCRKMRADKRFTSLTIIGHSEGSSIGMIASREAGADGYISIAGAGRPASDIILNQVQGQLPPDLLNQTKNIIEHLQNGEQVGDVPQVLNSLFRPSVQPYLISWFRYDPSVEISKLNIPVLILQGDTDIQVQVDDAKRLAQGNSSAKLVVISGMNHVLKTVSNDLQKQQQSYSDPSFPIASELISQIVSFIKNEVKQ